ARMKGARIIEGVPVTGFIQNGGAVAGVRTPRGDIEAEYVVNCAGMWARELGELAGGTIPLQAAEHHYPPTEPIDQVSRDWAGAGGTGRCWRIGRATATTEKGAAG